jgi:hypothetical protein
MLQATYQSCSLAFMVYFHLKTRLLVHQKKKAYISDKYTGFFLYKREVRIFTKVMHKGGDMVFSSKKVDYGAARN